MRSFRFVVAVGLLMAGCVAAVAQLNLDMIARRLILLLAFLGAAPAFAQQSVLSGSPWTINHAPMYATQGSGQAVISDSGPAGGGGQGLGLSELLLVAPGTGTPPFVGQGTGPNGTNFCDYDGPITNATGYHFLCFTPNATINGVQGGQIVYGAAGTAAALPLQFCVNGTCYTPGGTIAGLAVGTTTIGSGVTQQLLYDNAGVVGEIAKANSSVLITSGAGVPSWATTLPSGLTAPSLTVTTAFTATGLVTLADLTTIATNTVLVNATSGTASPTAQNVATCSSATSALIWTTNTGFGCNTSITAAAVPASGLTGTTLAAGVVTSSLTTVGTIGTGTWQGTVVGPTYGGTGINNGSFTITLAGNLVTSGAFNTTLTATATTNSTLPSGTHTLAGLDVAESFTAVQTVSIAPAANTSGDGLVLLDSTAASSGNQQYSPRLRLTGQGWKTNATAASQTVDWIIENQPAQAAANPSANLVFSSQINGGGYNALAAFTSNGNLIMVPTSASLTPGVAITQSLAGSSGFPTGNALNLINITSDNANLSGQNFLNGFSVSYVIGGSSMQGGRIGISSILQLNTATSASNATRNYVAVYAASQSTSGDGGTNTGAGAKGGLFGINPFGDAKSGATNMFNVTGGEFNVALETGSSAKYKTGMQIVDHALDAVAGASVDAGLVLSGQSGALGLSNGILFHSMSGQELVKSTGTLINADAATYATAIDFSALTLTNLLKGPNSFLIDNSGNVTAANLQMGAASTLYWTGRSQMVSPADGQITVWNAANTAFTRLNLGGTTSSFPAIKRNAAAINFRLADDSADAAITASQITVNGSVWGTIANLQGLVNPGYTNVVTTGVNFNAANTDTAITITPPTGYTRYFVTQIMISSASHTLVTATCGLFTATGGGGFAIQPAGTAVTVTTNAETTTNNNQIIFPSTYTTNVNATTLYFRIGTAEGAAATATVTLLINWIS